MVRGEVVRWVVGAVVGVIVVATGVFIGLWLYTIVLVKGISDSLTVDSSPSTETTVDTCHPPEPSTDPPFGTQWGKITLPGGCWRWGYFGG